MAKASGELFRHLSLENPADRKLVAERCAAMLVSTAAGSGEECFQVSVKGVTSGNVKMGDWLITVQKVGN